jgi:O-antigen/teichoic acid export membrane protein
VGIIARQSIKSSLVSFVGVGIGAITVLFLLPKYLSKEEIGLINTIQRIALLIYPFMVFGTIFTIRKYFLPFQTKHKDKDGGLFLSNLVLVLFTTTICTLLYVIFKENIIDYFKKSPLIFDYIYYPLYVALSIVVFQLLVALASAVQRITIPSLLSNTLNRFFALCAILIYAFMGITLKSFLGIYLLGFYFLPLVLLLIYCTYFLNLKLEWVSFGTIIKNIKTTFSYSSFLFMSMASGIIVQSLDSVMISSYKGLGDTAIYNIAFFIATFIEIPQRMLVQISTPLISKDIEKNNWPGVKKLYQKSSENQMFIAFFFLSLIWFNLNSIFDIMPNGDVYRQGYYVVLFLGVSKLIDLSFGLNKQIIEVAPYYKFNLVINVLLSVLVVAFNLIFIPKYGIIGAAFASFIAVTFVNILALLLVYYKSDMQPFTLKSIKFAAAAMILTSINYFFLPAISNPFISIIINSIIVGLPILTLAYILGMLDDYVKLIKP